jgi:uncharacterized protein (DUF58 family)
MNWSKYAIENHIIQGVSIFAFLLLIASFYLRSHFVFFLGSFFLILAWVNQLYIKNAGIGLVLENNVVKNRYFIGENGKWTLTFHNNGFPILKGEAMIYFDGYVSPFDTETENGRTAYELKVPVSLLYKQTKQITIPFQAEKRGIAKIRHLEFHIPNLIGFGEVVLEYKWPIKQEAVVYPNPIPVKGLNDQQSIAQGMNAVSYSVFEDRLGPMGTRDYLSTDSFNRIHWKASAKQQSLQTKIFERISEKGWNISINVADGYGITSSLEEILSSVAEFAYFAHKKQLPYSLCLNVRTVGNQPFYYISKGEGREHLQKVLETLASIHANQALYPYEKMLSFYSNHLAGQPYFLHAGKRNHAVDNILKQLAAGGTNLMELAVEKEYGAIHSLNFNRERKIQ